MDIGGEGALPPGPVEQAEAEHISTINISDVFEAISIADPSFQRGGGGGGGGGVEEEMYAPSAPAPPAHEAAPFVRILEQPASKALRFRYECEGRSAGSIPGANSTSEKKTFPTIEIVGHKGRAIVVVSCVTKDKPHRPHPHNLVGRDLCKKGVCTVNVNPESSIVTFSNLGIQCVKRRDIEEALRVREEMRVDPFKTGFAHASQPQSIDLNSVRLCFQVFLPDPRSGKIRHALKPVVSDVIYDKKAMSDLVIMKLSHCSASVLGGSEVILLCEKVAREDIAVTFFERGLGGDAGAWSADACDVHVHKQVAICFKTPRYRDIHVAESVDAFVQLRRLSDGATSEALPFELIPVAPGNKRKLPLDLSLFNILPDKRPLLDDNNNARSDNNDLVSSTSGDSVSVNVSSSCGSAPLADSLSDTVAPGSEQDRETVAADDANERTLNELLEQVAELDEIYSENQTRLQNVALITRDENDGEDFNDAGTYTSLQLAFKNPISIAEPDMDPNSYEDVTVHTFRGPLIEFSALKSDEDAPPLPPKRVRKAPSSHASVESLLKPGKQIPITRQQQPPSREISAARSEPALPPAPKKRSFFSRLFRRRSKSPAPSVRSEGPREKKTKPVARSVSSVSGIRPSKLKAATSHASLKDNASSASAAGLSYADSITHISLHADDKEKAVSQTSLRRPASLAPLPTDGMDGKILVAESVLALDADQFRKLQDDLDLTEAEHYALYMAVAPHATASEFDETSCYYSPVDGKPTYLIGKRQKRMADFDRFIQPDRDMNAQLPEYYDIMALQREQKPIKLEPRERTPPHPLTSPPLHLQYEDHEQYQWNMPVDNMALPGPSHLNPFHSPDMSWPANMAASPLNPAISPLGAAMSPKVGHMASVSPNIGHMAPVSPNNIGQVSPNHMGHSPSHMGHVSPSHMGHVSPNHMGHVSPSHMGHVSPNHMAHMSPNNMDHVSPNMHQMMPMMQQNTAQLQHNQHQIAQNQTSLMETATSDPPSITGLLLDRGDAMPQLNSSELSGLSSLLADAERGPDLLSDSLTRLSTGDLLPQRD